MIRTPTDSTSDLLREQLFNWAELARTLYVHLDTLKGWAARPQLSQANHAGWSGAEAPSLPIRRGARLAGPSTGRGRRCREVSLLSLSRLRFRRPCLSRLVLSSQRRRCEACLACANHRYDARSEPAGFRSINAAASIFSSASSSSTGCAAGNFRAVTSKTHK